MSEPEVPSTTRVEGWSRGPDGNWWPPSPPRQRPVRATPAVPPPERRGRRIAGSLGLVVFALAVLAVVVGIVAVLVDYDSGGSSTTTASSGEHTVGQTARTASFDVTLTGVQDPYIESNPTQQPSPGSHYVSVELTITNVATADAVVAPLQLIRLTDANGREAPLVPSTSEPLIEGVLPALQTKRGNAVFLVADSARVPLTLRVKGEPAAGGVTFSVP